jgi:hypothetical protein
MEGMNDFGDARDDHHGADHQHARHGRHDDAAEGDEAGDDVDATESYDPAPTSRAAERSLQRRENPAGCLKRLS